MKKGIVIGIIIGLLFGSASVYAVTNYIYKADEVSYTSNSSEWNVSDVKSAIDDLYNRTTTMMPIPTATKSITSNGSNIDVKNYAKVNVNVPIGGNSAVLVSSESQTGKQVWLHDYNATIGQVYVGYGPMYGGQVGCGGSQVLLNYNNGSMAVTIVKATDTHVYCGGYWVNGWLYKIS